MTRRPRILLSLLLLGLQWLCLPLPASQAVALDLDDTEQSIVVSGEEEVLGVEGCGSTKDTRVSTQVTTGVFRPLGVRPGCPE